MFDYCETEGNQVIIADFTDAWDYAGLVQQLRFDIYDGGCGDPDDSETVVYAAAFFKNYSDAVYFKAEGVNVELGAEYLEYAKELVEDASGDSTPSETNPGEIADTSSVSEPSEDTNAQEPAPDTNAESAKPADTSEKGTKESGKSADNKGSSKNVIIYVIIGVAAAAVVAVLIVILTKKKK